MDHDETTRKNLELHAEWMRYCFENPDVLDQIPQGARLVIIPNNDPDLAAENTAIVEACRTNGVPVVIVRLDLPKRSKPQMEVILARDSGSG